MKEISRRRGSTEDHSGWFGGDAEVTVDTGFQTLSIGDYTLGASGEKIYARPFKLVVHYNYYSHRIALEDHTHAFNYSAFSNLNHDHPGIYSSVSHNHIKYSDKHHSHDLNNASWRIDVKVVDIYSTSVPVLPAGSPMIDGETINDGDRVLLMNLSDLDELDDVVLGVNVRNKSFIAVFDGATGQFKKTNETDFINDHVNVLLGSQAGKYHTVPNLINGDPVWEPMPTIYASVFHKHPEFSASFHHHPGTSLHVHGHSYSFLGHTHPYLPKDLYNSYADYSQQTEWIPQQNFVSCEIRGIKRDFYEHSYPIVWPLRTDIFEINVRYDVPFQKIFLKRRSFVQFNFDANSPEGTTVIFFLETTQSLDELDVDYIDNTTPSPLPVVIAGSEYVFDDTSINILCFEKLKTFWLVSFIGKNYEQ